MSAMQVRTCLLILLALACSITCTGLVTYRRRLFKFRCLMRRHVFHDWLCLTGNGNSAGFDMRSAACELHLQFWSICAAGRSRTFDTSIYDNLRAMCTQRNNKHIAAKTTCPIHAPPSHPPSVRAFHLCSKDSKHCVLHSRNSGH